MKEKTVYDIIKKQNGEGFARILRENCLLDILNIADIVKYAGHSADDAKALVDYLSSQRAVFNIKGKTDGGKVRDPIELLDQAGYHAFEVHNLDEQNSIKRFFRKNEELCTFRDETRYQNNYIIHAIRHEVWHNPYSIQPSKTPERQDEYGTSVISIQISKSGGFISIKNRYNHTVQNPDQTFDNEPDKIITGLSAALKKASGIDWKQDRCVSIPAGFVLMKGKILKVNFEVNNRYVGDGFYTDNGNIIDIDKQRQIQIDYFIWDNYHKKLLNPANISDDFVRVFDVVTKGTKVKIIGKKDSKKILVNGKQFIKLQNYQIISLNLPGIEEIADNFLNHNTTLTHLRAQDLQQVGDFFLEGNTTLMHLRAQALQRVGNYFLCYNAALENLKLPWLQRVGNGFLCNNTKLMSFELPELQSVGSDFLHENTALTYFNAPELQNIKCLPAHIKGLLLRPQRTK